MSAINSTPRARPVTSAPPTSPRTEDSQGYRRGRAIRSCLECRRRKMRCNRARPCQNCNRFCRDCVYLPFPEWPSGASNNAKPEGVSQNPVHGGGRTIPSFNSNQNPGYVQPSPFTGQDYSYDQDTLARHDTFQDTDVDDDSVDMALQMGRLSITAKVGGCFRPHLATQVSIALSSSLEFHLPSQCKTHIDCINVLSLTRSSTDCHSSVADKSYLGPIRLPEPLCFTDNSASNSFCSTISFCPGQTNPSSRTFAWPFDAQLTSHSSSTRA